MKAVKWPPRILLEQRLEGAVVLENGAPRREAIEAALERAGYRRIEESTPAAVVDYRQAATPSLSMTFAGPRQRGVVGIGAIGPQLPKGTVTRVTVFRADERTMGYSIVLLPVWLLQVAGLIAGVVSIAAAALTGEPRSLAGLIVAGILFGLPKLWVDDAHHVVREALGELPAVDPLVAPPRSVPPLEAQDEEPAPPRERVRIATDEPALAAAAQTARDAIVRHETIDPEDAVEALERAGKARRGEGD